MIAVTPHDGCAGVGPSARRRRGRAIIRSLTAVIAVAAALLALAGCTSNTGSTGDGSPSTDSSYGALPSFLPTSSSRPDSVLIGTADRPALTAEGDGVSVQLPHASVLVTITGPAVPGEGLPHQTPSTTCTWTVTMTHATARVPITLADFSTLDHLGAVNHPTFVTGQPAPLATIGPGQTITFELRAVMTVGEGLIRWAPGGGRTVASWDFEVEND